MQLLQLVMLRVAKKAEGPCDPGPHVPLSTHLCLCVSTFRLGTAGGRAAAAGTGKAHRHHAAARCGQEGR